MHVRQSDWMDADSRIKHASERCERLNPRRHVWRALKLRDEGGLEVNDRRSFG